MSVPVTWSTLHGWYHTIDRYSASIFFIPSVLFSQMVWALCLYIKPSIPVQEKQEAAVPCGVPANRSLIFRHGPCSASYEQTGRYYTVVLRTNQNHDF